MPAGSLDRAPDATSDRGGIVYIGVGSAVLLIVIVVLPIILP